MAFSCSAESCPEQFSTRNLLNTHNINYHQSVVKAVKVKALPPQTIERNGIFLSCPCGAEFANRLALESHCSRCNLPSGEFACRQGCSATFPSESTRINHEKGLHGQTVTMHFKGKSPITVSRNVRREFICPQCSEPFVNNQTARSHAFVCQGPSVEENASDEEEILLDENGLPRTPPLQSDFNLPQHEPPPVPDILPVAAPQNQQKKRRRADVASSTTAPQQSSTTSSRKRNSSAKSSVASINTAILADSNGITQNTMPPPTASYRSTTNVRNTRSSKAAELAAMAESLAMSSGFTSPTQNMNNENFNSLDRSQSHTPGSDFPSNGFNWKNHYNTTLTPNSSRSASTSTNHSSGVSPSSFSWPYNSIHKGANSEISSSAFLPSPVDSSSHAFGFANKFGKSAQDDDAMSTMTSASDLSAIESASVLLSLRNGSVGRRSPSAMSVGDSAPSLTPDTSMPSANSALTMPQSLDASNSRSTRSSMISNNSVQENGITQSSNNTVQNPETIKVTHNRHTRKSSGTTISPKRRSGARQN